MANICEVCNKKIGVFTRIQIKDGFVCGDCQNKSLNMSNCNCRSAQDYLDRFAYLEENSGLFDSFNPTISVGEYLQVDEERKLFKIGKSVECFPFSYLVNFELNEDGETITKGGLGSAVVGGALFGGVGAVVGGIAGKKKNKAIVNSMYVRISLNDKWVKNTQINLISTETKKDGLLYNSSKAIADKIISSLELITNQQEAIASASVVQTASPADEILKYKQLLDAGAITDAEYAAKKKLLLNI